MLPQALAFLSNPKFWAAVSSISSAVGKGGGGSGIGGGGDLLGNLLGGGGEESQETPQLSSDKMPISLMGFPSQQRPSYGNIIQEMLRKTKL